jgi:hypothetical protein
MIIITVPYNWMFVAPMMITMRPGKRVVAIVGIGVAFILIVLALAQPSPSPPVGYPSTTRGEVIPSDVVKGMPANDEHPPVLNSSEWYDPVPLSGPINTAGAEDSPFITPDGSEMYFFFTPDVRKTPQQQLFDNVTGIWRSDWNGTGWSEPERVWLQDPGKLALDGAEFVTGDRMWFASAREGYEGLNWFIASLVDNEWQGWTYAGTS